MSPLVALSLLACLASRPLVMGRVMDHCDVASTLLSLGAPRDQISTWVCIAKWESSYDTAAIGNANSDGSKDYGLLQINSQYWCSPPGTGCNIDCNSLLSDDISDDWTCAKTVYDATQTQKGNGFEAWTTYEPHCAGDTSSYIDGCNL